jgi:hypothetical protein
METKTLASPRSGRAVRRSRTKRGGLGFAEAGTTMHGGRTVGAGVVAEIIE